jgi:hypothetical protein
MLSAWARDAHSHVLPKRKRAAPKRRPPFLFGMALTYFRSMQLA